MAKKEEMCIWTKKTPKGRNDPILTDEVINGLALALIKELQEYQKEQVKKKKAEKKKVDRSDKRNS